MLCRDLDSAGRARPNLGLEVSPRHRCDVRDILDSLEPSTHGPSFHFSQLQQFLRLPADEQSYPTRAGVWPIASNVDVRCPRKCCPVSSREARADGKALVCPQTLHRGGGAPRRTRSPRLPLWVTTDGFIGKSNLPAYPLVADGIIATARNSNRG